MGTEPLPPSEFLRRFPLPQIVRVHEGKVEGSKLDLRQPLLLFDTYKCRKLHARTLEKTAIGGLLPVGPQLIIPETYPGWFAVISNDGHTAGYFTSVEQITESQVSTFLVREDVTGFKVLEQKGGDGKFIYVKTKVKSGQVLRFIGAYEDISPRNRVNKVSGSFRRRSQYARCLTANGEIVFLPFSTEGKFYSVARRENRSIRHVFLAADIAKLARPPLTVRLVCGPHPPRLARHHFTSVLRLEEIRENDVILACAFKGHEPVLLEIDVSSAFGFVCCHPESLPPHRMATMRACVARRDSLGWKHQIKVAQHVVPSTYEDPSVASSRSTKRSTLSSVTSSILSRLHRWKKLRPKRRNTDEDQHYYETLRANTVGKKHCLGDLESTIASEFDTWDDGYVTSHVEEESLYYSIC